METGFNRALSVVCTRPWVEPGAVRTPPAPPSTQVCTDGASERLAGTKQGGQSRREN